MNFVSANYCAVCRLALMWMNRSTGSVEGGALSCAYQTGIQWAMSGGQADVVCVVLAEGFAA